MGICGYMCVYVKLIQAKRHFNVHFSDLLVLQVGFVTKNGPQARGGNRLHSQLPSECVYLESTRVYGDYQLKIAKNSSTL